MSRTVEFKLGGTLQFITDSDDYAGVYFTIHYRDFIITARGKDMTYTLPANMQVHVKVSYVDASGNPAQIDGDVTWDASNPDITDVVIDSADSTKAVISAPGPVGQAQVTATADADLGEGTRELITTMDIEVVAGEAVAGTISPSGPAEPIT